MKLKLGINIAEIRQKILQYKMKKRDKKLLIEAIIITSIYLLSFLMLSLGRVQQEFLGISQTAFSNLQILILTFTFAIIITLLIYFLYKKTLQ